MTGLLLIAVLLIWLAACVWLTQKIGNLLQNRSWRAVVKFALFAVLLPLPLIDEIIAKPQFEALCKEKAVIVVEPSKAQGRTVYLLDLPTEIAKGVMVPVHAQRWHYVDAKTKEAVVSFSTLQAEGGRLIHALGISETNAPLTFNGYCAPPNRQALFTQLEIRKVERSQIMQGERK